MKTGGNSIKFFIGVLVLLAAMTACGADAPAGQITGLEGKVLCGYQGWFAAPGDGSGRGWIHYAAGNRAPKPADCKFDLWPDLSEFDADEQYPTAFKYADGSTAALFSSVNRKTVLRHFRWMRDYGIDGAFLQRYPVETKGGLSLKQADAVLANCREGAAASGRSYSIMYATQPGPRFAGELELIRADWKRLVDETRLTHDEAYLRYKGKPLVVIWGVGFNDGRPFSLEEVARLIDFLKHDPQYGGCAVMLGVPTGWRTLDRDSIADPELHAVLQQADIISPWTPGRYNSPDGAASHAGKYWQPDIEWCAAHGLDYLPVIFPGFSWHNMYPKFPTEMIPRLKGEFYWKQFTAAQAAGAKSVYVAMFDEIDEGTAIFKCTNNPPVGESSFVTYEGLPSDFYLWLTGMGGRLLRGEIKADDGRVPARP